MTNIHFQPLWFGLSAASVKEGLPVGWCTVSNNFFMVVLWGNVTCICAAPLAASLQALRPCSYVKSDLSPHLLAHAPSLAQQLRTPVLNVPHMVHTGLTVIVVAGFATAVNTTTNSEITVHFVWFKNGGQVRNPSGCSCSVQTQSIMKNGLLESTKTKLFVGIIRRLNQLPYYDDLPK